MEPPPPGYLQTQLNRPYNLAQSLPPIMNIKGGDQGKVSLLGAGVRRRGRRIFQDLLRGGEPAAAFGFFPDDAPYVEL